MEWNNRQCEEGRGEEEDKDKKQTYVPLGMIPKMCINTAEERNREKRCAHAHTQTHTRVFSLHLKIKDNDHI